MPRIVLASSVTGDFDRIIDHLVEHEAENTGGRIAEIIEAISVLEHHPLIGHPVLQGKRELVIGRRVHGHVALYRYADEVDTVFILAVRSQVDAGYVLDEVSQPPNRDQS